VKQPATIETWKEFERQRIEMREQLRQDAMSRAEQAIADLAEIGFHYYLGETEKSVRPAKRAKQRTSTDKSARHKPSADKPCPICEYRTDPPHDRRSHRMQKRKRAFTDKELEAARMTRV
jgi:hypothetical protein